MASRFGETETLGTIHLTARGAVIRLSEEHDRADFRASIPAESPHLPLSHPASSVREFRMGSTMTGDADMFKVPSTIPQDLLLIHDLVGGDLSQTSPDSQAQAAETNGSSVTRTSNSEEGDTDSIASSSSEDSSDEEGDVDMSKADVIMKEVEVGKGAESEEEVEAGLLDGDGGGGGDPMTM